MSDQKEKNQQHVPPPPPPPQTHYPFPKLPPNQMMPQYPMMFMNDLMPGGGPVAPKTVPEPPPKEVDLPAVDEPVQQAPAKPTRKRKRKSKSSGPAPKKKRKVTKSNRGLRYFSKKVCEKVQLKKKTTYSEVANELVAEYTDKKNPKDEQVHEEKNIRRRVYDALNVLMALDIISKNRKEITWKGYPVNFQQEFDVLVRQKEDISNKVQEKRRQLIELERQKLALQKLFERNEKDEFKNVDDTSKVHLPFIVVHTNKETVIECQMDSEATDEPFEIHDDNEILQRIFAKDFFPSMHMQIPGHVKPPTQPPMPKPMEEVQVENPVPQVPIGIAAPPVQKEDEVTVELPVLPELEDPK